MGNGGKGYGVCIRGREVNRNKFVVCEGEIGYGCDSWFVSLN